MKPRWKGKMSSLSSSIGGIYHFPWFGGSPLQSMLSILIPNNILFVKFLDSKNNTTYV